MPPDLFLYCGLQVAELILDADVPGVHEHKEYESHLRANISDSLNVLGKLAAGMDVNIRCVCVCEYVCL